MYHFIHVKAKKVPVFSPNHLLYRNHVAACMGSVNGMPVTPPPNRPGLMPMIMCRGLLIIIKFFVKGFAGAGVAGSENGTITSTPVVM